MCTSDQIESKVEAVNKSVLGAMDAIASPASSSPGRPLASLYGTPVPDSTVSSPGMSRERRDANAEQVSEYLGSSPGPDRDENPGRPRLWRASTSGTQIFRLSDEGVELNLLPVGPDASDSRWEDSREGKWRRGRSFL